jgi:predicted transcriptional regulator
LKKRTVVVLILAIFSSIESIIVVATLTSGAATLSGTTWSPWSPASSTGGALGFFRTYSPHLSVIGWVAVGLALFQGRVGRSSKIRGMFARMGFDGDVYNLMVGMRGGPSRLALLQSMDAPRNRLELSDVTGLDWKEVDRQVGVLEKYGLVKVHAEFGSVKMFQITEQGRLLLELIDELKAPKPVLRGGGV